MSAIEGFRVFLQVFQNIGRENQDPGIHAQSTSAEHDSYQWDGYGSVSSRLISGPSDISVDHVGRWSPRTESSYETGYKSDNVSGTPSRSFHKTEQCDEKNIGLTDDDNLDKLNQIIARQEIELSILKAELETEKIRHQRTIDECNQANHCQISLSDELQMIKSYALSLEQSLEKGNAERSMGMEVQVLCKEIQERPGILKKTKTESQMLTDDKQSTNREFRNEGDKHNVADDGINDSKHTGGEAQWTSNISDMFQNTDIGITELNHYRYAENNSDLARAHRDLENVENHLDKTKGYIVSLENDIVQANNRIVKLDNELGQAKKQIFKLEDIRVEAAHRIAKLEDELNQATCHIVNNEDELGRAKTHSKNLENYFCHAEYRVAHLTDELRQTKADKEKLKSDLILVNIETVKLKYEVFSYQLVTCSLFACFKESYTARQKIESDLRDYISLLQEELAGLKKHCLKLEMMLSEEETAKKVVEESHEDTERLEHSLCGPYSYFPSPLPSSRQSPSSSPPKAEEYQTECPLSCNSTDMNPSANQQTTKKQAETRIVERPDSMAQDLDLRRRSAQQARYASELEQLNANCYKTEGAEGGVIADDDSQADEDGENQKESRRVQDAFITEEEGELIEEECEYQSNVENEEDHEINDDEDADSKIDDIDNDSRDSSNDDDDDDDKTEDAEPSSFILYDEDGRMKEEC